MKSAADDTSPFGGGSMLRQASAAAATSLPRTLPPQVAAEQLGSCTLLLLGLPARRKKGSAAAAAGLEDDEELQVGLDCALWRVGPEFCGVKCIQPGCHLLYSRVDRTEVSAAELAQHAARAEKAIAQEDAAAAALPAGEGDGSQDEAGAPAVDSNFADATQATSEGGGFECMYTAMRVEEAIGEVDREKRGGLHQGEFIYMEPHEVCVRLWDRRSKCFVRLTDEEEEQRYIRGVKRLEFDKKLGLYPQQFRSVWNLLTDFISRQCLRRLEPLSRSFAAASLPLSGEEERRLRQQPGEAAPAEGAGRFFPAAEDELSDSPKGRQRQKEEDEKETGVKFYFTEIPPARAAAVAAARRAEVRAKHLGATAEEAAAAAAAALTEAAVDRTDTLLQVLKKINSRLDDLENASNRKQSAAAASRRTVAELFLRCAPLPHSAADAAAAVATAAIEEERLEEERLWRSLASSEACQDLLGEVQLAFLAFLLGHRYDGFEQWKQLLLLLSQCARAVQLLPEFYASLLRVFYCQLEQCPNDLLQDPLLQRSFLVASAASLVNICSNVLPLPDGSSDSSGSAGTAKKIAIERKDVRLDRAERGAMLQRVEQRAAWLQQLLNRTFGEAVVDPTTAGGLASGNGGASGPTASAELEQLRRDGLACSSLHEDEDDGPVVVDEEELLRAGVYVDDSSTSGGTPELGPQPSKSGATFVSTGSGEKNTVAFSASERDSNDAGGQSMDVDSAPGVE